MNRIEVRSGIQESPLKATTGLLIYEQNGHYGEKASFATIHDVETDNNGQPFFLSGRPITREALMALNEKLVPESTIDYLPPEALAVGSDWMVWWKPAGDSTLFFDTGKTDPIGKCALVTNLPALVFAVKGPELYVFTLAGANRPLPGDALCMAPFYNVWDDGRLCQGSGRRPERTGFDMIPHWESMLFFGSAFTHPNTGHEKLTTHPKGVAGLWREIAAGKHKRFPVKRLAPANMTLADLVAKLKQRGRAA